MTELAERITTVTQSKYFSPAFNAAIFDGPLRIYFAQYQEAEALKLYFRMQEEMTRGEEQVRSGLKQQGKNVFIFLYPSSDTFQRSFAGHQDSAVVEERLGQDLVVGLNGPILDADYDRIFNSVNHYAVGNA